MSEFNLAKLVPFLTFLLLWQLGFDFKSQGIAQTSKLPPDEENAFRDFINRLELTQTPFFSLSLLCSNNSNYDMTVRCNCAYERGSVCHITEIILKNLNMRGFIHPAISNLTYLETLDLSYNVLGGGIPDSVGNLSSLNYLVLGNNQLTGNIPTTLGNLKNLTFLDLEYNLLEGEIPPALGALSSLSELFLSFNLLTNKIPNELGNLTELEYLSLQENQLSGPLPEGLSRLSNLWGLWLTSNNLTGGVPESYIQLKSLKAFVIAGNYLSGSIPKFIKNWTNLTVLALLGNNFEGPLPTEIFEMSNLRYLWVSDLNNSGFPFPKSANLKNIYSLRLRNCSINGPIPTYIGSWSSLTYIDLSFNNLRGEIPDSIQNLTLSDMYLSRNMLSGTIPDWIPRHVRVDLSYNNFNGIPKAKKEKGISQPIKENATLYACCSTGAPNEISPFSTEKKNCTGGKSKDHSLFINCGGQGTTVDRNYYEADNSKSDFYESPKQNWAYSCSGDFFSETANSSNYITNQRCGVSVPEAQLYAESRFCPISLTYYGFCLHKGNYSVTLHFAETVYTNDADYSNLGKRVFDVYIQGERKLTDFNIKEKAGGPNKAWNQTFYVSVNNDPLVIHFLWAGKGSLYNPPALNGPLVSAISVTHVRSGKLSPSHIALITVASVITPLLLLAFVWQMGWLGNRELEERYIELPGRYVTLKHLIAATQNFSSRKEIGRGRFAKVYEAEFKMPDLIVAVKKYSSQSKLAMDNFTSQLLALKTLRHDNVVQLFDGYSEKDLHLLIYEYMEHKSLDRALFGVNPLGWNARFNICLGVARGLKYLHEQERLQIVHRSIKASNILLDRTLNAKISDFGLARLYDDEDQLEAIRARVTRVYMAPEYAMRNIKTDKADVYSFGVVLLEIVSGKSSAKKEENRESKFLIDTACDLDRKRKLMELVDEKLSKYDNNQVNTVLSLAMMCIDPSPDIRPTMSEVVSVLEGENSIQQISKAVTDGNQSYCPTCRQNYFTTA